MINPIDQIVSDFEKRWDAWNAVVEEWIADCKAEDEEDA